MKKPTAKGGSKPPLHEEDVWAHTARSIQPLKKAKDRFHPAAELAKESVAKAATGRTRAKPQIEAIVKAKTAAVAPMPMKPELPSAKSFITLPKPPPPVATFDRKKARKIRTGQVEIEARIDLHGMRQDEAHTALAHFLNRCQGKGQRWVLVITGKGKISDGDNDGPFDMTRQRERGVLKRNVPRWLDEPALRGLVVSYTTAAIQHGGEGALYVHLRKR